MLWFQYFLWLNSLTIRSAVKHFLALFSFSLKIYHQELILRNWSKWVLNRKYLFSNVRIQEEDIYFIHKCRLTAYFGLSPKTLWFIVFLQTRFPSGYRCHSQGWSVIGRFVVGVCAYNVTLMSKLLPHFLCGWNESSHMESTRGEDVHGTRIKVFQSLAHYVLNLGHKYWFCVLYRHWVILELWVQSSD